MRWFGKFFLSATAALLASFLAAGCGPGVGWEPGTTSQALISHGPTSCSGSPPPDWNYADIFAAPSYNGGCQRWRGDMNIGSQHIGFVITPTFPAKSIKISTVYRPLAGLSTSATVCQGAATGPSYAPCAWSGSTIFLSSGGTNAATFFPWTPTVVVLGATPYCPNTADWYAAQGGHPLPYPRAPAGDSYPAALSWTSCGYTFDGSGLPAYVATDNAGHPINLPTASGFNVECIIDPAQPPIAPGAPAGKVVAVYGC